MLWLLSMRKLLACYVLSVYVLRGGLYMSISLPVCAELSPTSRLIPSLTVLSGYSLRLCCLTHAHTQTRLPALKKVLASAQYILAVWQPYSLNITLQCFWALHLPPPYILCLSLLSAVLSACLCLLILCLSNLSPPPSSIQSLFNIQIHSEASPCRSPPAQSLLHRIRYLLLNLKVQPSFLMLHINQRFILELRFWWSVQLVFTHRLSIQYCSHTFEFWTFRG